MSEMAGVRFAFSFTTARSGVPQAACRVASGQDPAPQRAGPRGAAPPPRCAPAPHPAPARPRPRAVPAPPPRPPLPPPGSPARPPKLRARPGSARSCSGGRMPSVSVSCYGNPDRGEFRIRSETEPRAPPDPPLRIPGPPAPGRPRAQAPARGRLEVLLLRPQHPAPEMPGMQIEQNLLSLCIASKRARFWLLEPLKTTRTPGKPGHAPGFSIEDP